MTFKLLREKTGQIGQEKPRAMPVDWPRQEEDDVLGRKSLLNVLYKNKIDRNVRNPYTA